MDPFSFEGRAMLSVWPLNLYPKGPIKIFFPSTYNKMNFNESYHKYNFPVTSASQRCFCAPRLPQAPTYLSGLFSLIPSASDYGFPISKGETKIIFLCVGLNRHNKKRMNGRHVIHWKLKLCWNSYQTRIRDV